MAYRVSDWEIDEHVEREQIKRHEARCVDDRWVMVDPDDGLPGLVWQWTKGEG